MSLKMACASRSENRPSRITLSNSSPPVQSLVRGVLEDQVDEGGLLEDLEQLDDVGVVQALEDGHLVQEGGLDLDAVLGDGLDRPHLPRRQVPGHVHRAR